MEFFVVFSVDAAVLPSDQVPSNSGAGVDISGKGKVYSFFTVLSKIQHQINAQYT